LATLNTKVRLFSNAGWSIRPDITTGYFNAKTNFYSWEGIQYGHVERFQQPTTPINLPAIQNAFTTGPFCSQFAANGINPSPALPGAEQCLFLNVYVPPQLRCSNESAPVVVWIHGGGYGYGYPDFAGPVTSGMGLDNGTTILVTIQYRLGIFGFLAGKEVHNNGNSNLGVRACPFVLLGREFKH
jgi:carboxylesterase type B